MLVRVQVSTITLKTLCQCLVKLNISLPYDLGIHFQSCNQNKCVNLCMKRLGLNVPSSIIHNNSKLQAIQMCINRMDTQRHSCTMASQKAVR